MLLNQFPRTKKWLLGVAILLCSCAIIFWAGAHLFVPGVIKKTVAEFGDKIGYEIAYKDLSISPLRLKLELSGLHLAKEGGTKLLEFKNLAITLRWIKLVQGEIGFGEISLEEPKILVEKSLPKGERSGAWNWQEFIAAIEKALPPPDPSEVKKPVKISVAELEVSSASLSLVDDSTKLKEELKPFTMKLLEVPTMTKMVW